MWVNSGCIAVNRQKLCTRVQKSNTVGLKVCNILLIFTLYFILFNFGVREEHFLRLSSDLSVLANANPNKIFLSCA